MKIWVISDTHWKHKNIIKYENRPLDHNEQIVANWCKLVAPDDLVIHLGDVIFGENKQGDLKEILAKLPGKKILCRGNHDGYPTSKWGDWEWYLDCGFDAVTDYFVYQDLAFSHAPLTPLPTTARYGYGQEVRLNIHGHFHRGSHRKPHEGEDDAAFEDQFYDYKYYKEHKKKYHLVQIEDTLSPFLLDDIIKQNES